MSSIIINITWFLVSVVRQRHRQVCSWLQAELIFTRRKAGAILACSNGSHTGRNAHVMCIKCIKVGQFTAGNVNYKLWMNRSRAVPSTHYYTWIRQPCLGRSTAVHFIISWVDSRSNWKKTNEPVSLFHHDRLPWQPVTRVIPSKFCSPSHDV